MTEDLPLHGIKVLELAQMVAGPAAGLLLADYGAEVIKVEPPNGDGGRHLRSLAAAALPDSPVFVGYNRDKRLLRLTYARTATVPGCWISSPSPTCSSSPPDPGSWSGSGWAHRRYWP